MAISTLRALQALRAVQPGLTEAAEQILLGQVKGESNFGNAVVTPDGSDSNNWGMIYAPGDRGTIPVGDTDVSGKKVTAGAAWNSTPEVGAAQYVRLIRFSYPEAFAAALAGDAWGYAHGLWRDGPGSKRPSYYAGFPPGHKWSCAPKGTAFGSPQDWYWRQVCYAKMVQGGASSIAKEIGQTPAVFLHVPPAPTGGGVASSSSSTAGAGAVMLLSAAAMFAILGGKR